MVTSAASVTSAADALHYAAALYMASLSAINHNPILRTFHARLIERGKKFKVALTAVMRKLLIALNSALKNPNFQLAS